MTGKIKLESIKPKNKGLENRKINNKKILIIFNSFLVLLSIYLYVLKLYRVLSILPLFYFYHTVYDH